MEDVVMLDTFPIKATGKNDSGENLPQISPDSAMVPSQKCFLVKDLNSAKDLGPPSMSVTSNETKKSLKRKRATSAGEVINKEGKELCIASFRQEIDGLFRYFKDVWVQKVNLGDVVCSIGGKCGFSMNSTVACLLEESNLPFSKLVERIFEDLKRKEGGEVEEITLASVRSSVLFVGQRSLYGIANADADVLEDDSESCLWCWETRDLKLFPKDRRGVLNIRRICRKKIHERITALSAMILSLSSPECQPNHKLDVMKAAEKLGKALNEEQIRALVENLLQKNDSHTVEKEAKLKEKELMKELEWNKRNAEKEKKRMDRELKKEKLQNEKELKRQQDELEKEERRREKEEAELKKLLKRQQDEAEKDQRRREKEETAVKKQVAIQKQATIMERFLNSKKPKSKINDSPPSMKALGPESSEKKEDKSSAIVVAMDSALTMQDGMSNYDLLRAHLIAWHSSSHLMYSSRSRHWGTRHNPKVALVKELKLQGSAEAEPAKGTSPPNDISELGFEKLVDGWTESVSDERSCHNNVNTGLIDTRLRCKTKKLLQFDKSHRPAYYGTLSKSSDVVGPRHPFRKDPNLDYDIESDEEWEEEDPGESLSDCDRDEEEENLDDEGNTKIEDEDGSEDGFLVPDGYLSENEGVHVDNFASDEDEVKSSPNLKQDPGSEEFGLLLRQQKYLHNLTEHALRKNQALIILNIMNEKAPLMMVEDLSGIPKLEQICLQALSIRPCFEGASIDLSTANTLDDDQEICKLQSRCNNTTPAVAASVLVDSDLPAVVSTIRSCSHGINKVVESLQKKFPTVPKLQLRCKVREISDYVDNRWKVKNEVLEKLGLFVTPEKSGSRKKGIATFFSKRCLPPEGEVQPIDSPSPQQCRKPDTHPLMENALL